jgi:hypothetical protein
MSRRKSFGPQSRRHRGQWVCTFFLGSAGVEHVFKENPERDPTDVDPIGGPPEMRDRFKKLVDFLWSESQRIAGAREGAAENSGSGPGMPGEQKGGTEGMDTEGAGGANSDGGFEDSFLNFGEGWSDIDSW